MRVGLAGKFDEETDRTVADQIKGQEVPLKGPHSTQSPEDKEEEDALEEGLVKLRRMTQLPGGVSREVHSPGKRGHPSIKLPVDEVSDTSESITQGNGRAEEVGKLPEGNPVFMAKDNGGNKNGNCPPMIRHPLNAADPNLGGKVDGQEYFQGMSRKIFPIVEKDVPQPSPDDHTQNGPEKETLDGLF